MNAARRLVVVTPHGFCSGVARAVAAAEEVLARCRGQAVYCLNEIVHNRQVSDRLGALGLVFVGSVGEVPQGSIVLFSAHGVAPAVRREAEERRLSVVDATCPFVTKVHAEVRRFVDQGATVVCVGHRRHEEVVGVAGEAPGHVRVVESVAEVNALDLPAGVSVAVVTQTTLGEEQAGEILAALRGRYPGLLTPPSTDICYATRNRQRAVRLLARLCDRVLVLGSANSSNSQRLVEAAREAGAEAFLISTTQQLEEQAWGGVRALGLTSGASTPEAFLRETVGLLQARFGFEEAESLTAVPEESPLFALPALPARLRDKDER